MDAQGNLKLGYRFIPTQTELLLHYLLNKILGRDLPVNIIPMFDCFSCSPDRFPFERFTYGKTNVWYFFSKGSESRVVVTTEDGYYQLYQQDQEYDSDDEVIGFVRSFNFFHGRPSSGNKTVWSIDEFRVHPRLLHGSTLAMDPDLVACKVTRNVPENIDWFG